MALIAFKEDTELTLIDGFDEENDNITSESVEVFKKDETVDVDIIPTSGATYNYVDIQFPDGSVALGVHSNSFTIISDDDDFTEDIN